MFVAVREASLTTNSPCLGLWAGGAMGAPRATLLGRAQGEGQVKTGCHSSYCMTPNSHGTVWSSPIGLTELNKSKKVEPEGRGQKNKGKKGLEARAPHCDASHLGTRGGPAPLTSSLL